jgi:hypothetical protein
MKENLMAYMYRKMISCEETAFLVSYRQDKKLTMKQTFQLRMHLFTCHLCRKYASQIKQLQRALDHHRERSSMEPCMHHLTEEECAHMQHAIEEELNAK